MAPVRLPGLFALLAFASGCGRDDESVAYTLRPASGRDGIALDVVLDLAAEFPWAESWFEREIIEPGLYADRAHLTGGWSFPDPKTGDEKATELWAIGREAELTFHISEIAPRRLRFRAFSYLPGGGENRVDVRLNGEAIEGFVLGPEKRNYELHLPVLSQREGKNRVTLAFSRTTRLIDVGESTDMRSFSGCFGRIEVVVDDPAVERRSSAARAMLPRGSELALEGQAIEQVSGSLLRFHAKVPEAADFTAELGLVRRSSGSVERARFRLTAVRDGEAPLALLDESVAWTTDGELEAIRVPLDALAGQVVALELCVAADAAVVGVWGLPRVSSRAVPAVSPPTPAPAPPELDDARAHLRHAPVVVLLLDAFNPTFMTAYGGRAGLTPNLDRIAAEGVLFEEVCAPASYTLASIGTILTSQPSWRHGVWNETTHLLPGVETWPERFAAAGYRTVGIVCSVNGSSTFGYQRGFETYVEVWKELEIDSFVHAGAVLPFVERALAAPEGDDRPLFLWMHIREPHEPYDDSPWRGRLDPDYEGTVTGTTKVLSDIRDGIVVPSERDLEHLRAQYEEGLGYVDEVLGEVRSKLAAAGFLDEGVLAIVSDHGEAFMEHRPKGRLLVSHGSTVYEVMVQVPLLVRLPDEVAGRGARARRVVQRVTSADLLPTLADLVDVAPIASARAESFASLLFGSEGYRRRSLWSHSFPTPIDRFVPEFALWEDGYKYIHGSGGGDELYRSGAREEDDLAAELPVLTGWMRQELHRLLGFDPDTGAVPASMGTQLDPDVIEQMRALGYMR